MSDNLKGLLDQIASPSDLRKLLDIEGMTGAVVEQFVAGVGAATALDQIFGLMAMRFTPKGRLRSGVVQWNIATSTGRHRYQLFLTPQGARAERGNAAPPRVLLAMSTPTLLNVCAGRFDPIAALGRGELKIRGDLLFGALMPRWFDY
ncbi:SCP2 sterol-binding domain-containing protein [Actinomadura barringtoniae]|uniref:SCP2 sterol-binding domain-containing protein n=1 Tax=Actinomadura barringtoniae TaxID=1427535 RepID=A0A939TA35_9ACTN|nr:SCP2 sterol-binding domain-containing protein [Actinomadura barringtoniae]MBO2455723.1 SCP2 sterol-binding domain-containing protein [Actinomadura barringtoniae]